MGKGGTPKGVGGEGSVLFLPGALISGEMKVSFQLCFEEKTLSQHSPVGFHPCLGWLCPFLRLLQAEKSLPLYMCKTLTYLVEIYKKKVPHKSSELPFPVLWN